MPTLHRPASPSAVPTAVCWRTWPSTSPTFSRWEQKMTSIVLFFWWQWRCSVAAVASWWPVCVDVSLHVSNVQAILLLCCYALKYLLHLEREREWIVIIFKRKCTSWLTCWYCSKGHTAFWSTLKEMHTFGGVRCYMCINSGHCHPLSGRICPPSPCAWVSLKVGKHKMCWKWKVLQVFVMCICNSCVLSYRCLGRYPGTRPLASHRAVEGRVPM